MSVYITKPISGIRIEGLDYDLRPKEAFAGTFETATDMNVEIKVDDAPAPSIAKEKPRGKPIAGRVWAEPEKKTSTTKSGHRPSKTEALTRRARVVQLREFVKERKEEINRKILQAKQQRVEARKKKEKNDIRGTTFQVIKDTKKLKKWSKKARKQLMKMPKDMFESYLKTSKQKHDEENAS